MKLNRIILRQQFSLKKRNSLCEARTIPLLFVKEITLRKRQSKEEKQMNQSGRKSYMDYWHFTPDEKQQLIARLTKELPALRGAAKATQDEIANAIGVSRQTYSAVEMQKRAMSWNTYMSLILFFDYNPSTHYTIRQLDAFPYRLDECWLSGKMAQQEANNNGD